MAYNYTEPGHTPIVLNATYSRWSRTSTFSFHSTYRLKAHDLATGTCKLVAENHGHALFISETALSHWYLIRRPGAT